MAWVIHWFRRDLRLTDNTALTAAAAGGFAGVEVAADARAESGGGNAAGSRASITAVASVRLFIVSSAFVSPAKRGAAIPGRPA